MTVSRPYWLMIIGLTTSVAATLVQRVGATAVGVSPDTEGYKTLLLIWWIIGAVPFLIGFTMLVLGVTKDDEDD